VLSAAESPLVVQSPNQGHGKAPDLLDREGGISQPVQVHQIGLAMAMPLIQLAAKASIVQRKRVLGRISGVETSASPLGEAILDAPKDLILLEMQAPDDCGVVGLLADGSQL
jgi:hypothetical protein